MAENNKKEEVPVGSLVDYEDDKSDDGTEMELKVDLREMFPKESEFIKETETTESKHHRQYVYMYIYTYIISL